jgi:2-dehydropantoate 2-reductase
LYGRTAQAEVEVRLDGGDPVVVPGPVHTDPSSVNSPAELVFVAVKGTQLVAAAPWLARLCDAGTIVCVLQNGVEQRASVEPLAGAARVLPAAVWFAAQVEPGGWVRLHSAPRLTLPAGADAEVVRAALCDSICVVELTDDFASVTWDKLLSNALGGLMVLAGRRSGMFRRDDIGELAIEYVRECMAVARAEGAVVDDGLPQQLVARYAAYPQDLGNSILADRLAARPLEWRERNEVIVRLADKHAIEVPISRVLVPLLAAASDGPG